MKERRFLVFLALAALVSSCGREKPPAASSAARPALGRVIVVGFDGMEPTLVRKWVGEGKLPNFKRVIEEGAFGDLLSVVPPSSAPAWTSAVTGVNPGKHGIYGFLVNAVPGLSPQGGKSAPGLPVFSTSSNRGFRTVWDVAGSYGRRSILINIPLTSPADSLNGIMIAGFPHASNETTSYYWPASVAKYLTDYTFDTFGVPVSRGQERKFIQDQNASSEKRLRLGLTLFDQGNWDLFWIVFTFTDQYQHYFWKFMDSDHPLYNPEGGRLFGDTIESAYKMADAYLGEFLKRMQDSDLVLVMSDHGFGPVYYVVNSYNFVFRTLGSTPDVTCADFFGVKYKVARAGEGAEDKYSSLRNQLRASLLALQDPRFRTNIVDSVYFKEEIYKGPYLSMAPDVVGLEKDKYLFFTLPWTPDLRLFDAGPNPDEMFSGFHRRRGTLGLYGKFVKPGQTVEARIVDVTPVILTYLGVPAPAEIDGKIPSGIFREEIAGRMTLVKSRDSGFRKPASLTQQDSKKIEKQLRALGYIQ